MNDPTSWPRYRLRDLPLSARLVLATFLISVGVGYFSALVQLHFQVASPGELLPTVADTTTAYHGDLSAMSAIERLLTADERKPFNGKGSMRAAFFRESTGWDTALRKLARKMEAETKAKPDEAAVEQALRKERELEINGLLQWIHAGAKEADYNADEFVLKADSLPVGLRDLKLSNAFVETDPKGDVTVKIKTVIDRRCVRCHATAKETSAADAPLHSYESIQPYLRPERRGGMGLARLAQTTHVHLLGFAMLYGLTGLLFALTSYPRALRLVVAPLPLVAQMIDIGCWWLARFDPTYAHLISITGAIVAAGLGLHVVLTLFNLFGRAGRVVLALLLIAAAGGGFVFVDRVIGPYLIQEKAAGAANGR
jgi:hypothetical protein